jgi:UV excision repair protein RAD23
LDFLRQLPQFNMMRRMIQANPALLAQLLQQLDQANPALLSVINANQAEFVRLINEPVPPGEEGGDEEMAQLAAAMAGAGGGAGVGGGGMGGDGRPAPPGQIYVTEEENQQLVRLTDLGQSMGLQRIHVVEAWLACDRDENLAANYLFDHQADIQRAQEEDAADEAAAGAAGGDDDGGEGDLPDADGSPPPS